MPLAESVKEELAKVFLKEEGRLNAVAFTIRERKVHEPDARRKDLPDMEFPFRG
jgi:hypothetical protein